MARVVALAPDLFFASKIEATLTAAGHQVKLTSRQADTIRAAMAADVIVVDLHADDLDASQLIRALHGKPALGFFSHVDEDTKHSARLAGFDVVVPRSRMAREMPDLVAGLTG